jgi:hypothetical protein
MMALATLWALISCAHGRYFAQEVPDGPCFTHVDVVSVFIGPYNKLRLSVHKRAVQFSRVFVEFRNGDRIEVPVRERIHAGGQSRVIDLPGRGRYIKKVILWYKTAPGTLERAQVAVWARR